MQKVTLGGERLGSGSKMKVELHGYERSTHDLGYLWRSTMSAGTLVPFLSEVALPGDTFDIHLDADIKTHPTVGPLFGSYKVQLDIFQAPIRLYQGQLHNNKLGIGMHMANIKFPTIRLAAVKRSAATFGVDDDNYQINPSCILSYLGLRGVGYIADADTDEIGLREFNAIPLLAYWDIYKNYYANKQEEIGVVIHKAVATVIETVDTLTVEGSPVPQNTGGTPIQMGVGSQIVIQWTGSEPQLDQILLYTTAGMFPLTQLMNNIVHNVAGTEIIGFYNNRFGNIFTTFWQYIQQSQIPQAIAPTLNTFDLGNIDLAREYILTFATSGSDPLNLNDDFAGLTPYEWLINTTDATQPPFANSQEGLAIKTYQSDLFNNWLSTEWIDGAEGISAVTAIDTSGGSFTIDTLNLSKKVYNMLNRIAVSGGSYDDWLDAVYDHNRIQRAETPIYHGGLIKELVFQEVVSNSNAETQLGQQPLGTLAGKGIMSKKHKGGVVTVKVDEPSYIMGIISLTPRLDYSQGNKWDLHLETMDDLHKPALDEIGFQELVMEQMGWWTTAKTSGSNIWTTKSAGKQPAWINYMTNVNQCRGNFAIQSNEMFMTLNRRYEHDNDGIVDMTTYIDPVKFNQIFAVTAIDAQNFWAQIAVDITARRKMSAKIMPNL